MKSESYAPAPALIVYINSTYRPSFWQITCTLCRPWVESFFSYSLGAPFSEYSFGRISRVIELYSLNQLGCAYAFGQLKYSLAIKNVIQLLWNFREFFCGQKNELLSRFPDRNVRANSRWPNSLLGSINFVHHTRCYRKIILEKSSKWLQVMRNNVDFVNSINRSLQIFFFFFKTAL